MIVVSDTSPRTALLTVGQAQLLVRLFGEVLMAKRQGLISSARSLLLHLDQEAGIYLAEEVKETALKSVGE